MDGFQDKRVIKMTSSDHSKASGSFQFDNNVRHLEQISETSLYLKSEFVSSTRLAEEYASKNFSQEGNFVDPEPSSCEFDDPLNTSNENVKYLKMESEVESELRCDTMEDSKHIQPDFSEHISSSPNDVVVSLEESQVCKTDLNTLFKEDNDVSVEEFYDRFSYTYSDELLTGNKYTNTIRETVLSCGVYNSSFEFIESPLKETVTDPKTNLEDTRDHLDGKAITDNEVMIRSTVIATACGSKSLLIHKRPFSVFGKYVCSNCGKIFNKKVGLHCHLISENIEHLCECRFCESVFSPNVEVNTSLVSQNNKRIILTCFYCPQKFTNDYLFKDHLKTHCTQQAYAFDKGFSSNEVGDNYSTESSNKDGSRKRYSCYVCGKSFLSKDYLKIHCRTHTGEKTFKCHICSKSFYRNSMLQSHLKIHFKKIYFPCSECNVSFPLKIAYNNHMKRVHKSYVQSALCDECGMTFSSIQDLQKHLELKKSSDLRYQGSLSASGSIDTLANMEFESNVADWPYSCKSCGITFTTEKSFQVHLKSHTKQKNWECGSCGKSFSRKWSLNLHESTHLSKPLFNCKYCGKGFVIKCYLIRHLRTHTNDRPIECRICGKGFAQFSDRTVHERRHTGIKPYQCKECGKNCITKAKLKDHSNAHLLVAMFPCHQCTKLFKTQYLLTIHVKNVHSERNYKHQCTLCRKKFLYKPQLESHLESHVNGRPALNCDHCEKKFLNRAGLTFHMRCHTGEKEFGCDICGRKFSRKYVLKQHILAHFQERSLSCKICEKKFVLKRTLDSHMDTHLTERLFHCAECSQSFKTKAILKSHLNTHMKVKFLCELCDKSFCRNALLKSHVLSEHKVKLE